MSLISSSTLGTTSIDGLISGLDTTSIISSLAAIRTRPVDLVKQHITRRTQDIASYQALSAKMLALSQSAGSLSAGTALAARTATVSDTSAVVATAGSGAAVGNYELVISQLAQAHKVSSGAVADIDAALGYAGDILVNGTAIALTASDDLASLRDKLNGAQAGVTASIITVSATDHRLILRSQTTGADGALDLNTAGGDLLQTLGLLDGTTTTKHALADGMTSDGLTSRSDAIGEALGLGVAPAGTIRINDTEVAVDLAQDSLEDLADRITATVSGVTATVVTDDSGDTTRYSLQLTGDAAPTLQDDAGVLETLGMLQQGVAHEVQAAQDAEFTLDGYAIARATNSVDDVLTGVSLQLQQADENQAITLTVAANNQAAVTAVQKVVDDYNAVVGAINTGMTWNTETESGGVFFSDASILALQNGLHGNAMLPAATLGGNLTLMSQIGLSSDRFGLLSLDTGKLLEALDENPEGVLRVLTTGAETTDDEVEYVSSGTSTADSGAGGYAVHVTQAATKAKAQSAELVSLAQDEDLTINGSYVVHLDAGMTLAQAADKLNQILGGNDLPLTASVVGSRLQLESNFYGSNYGFSIASSLDDGGGGTDLGGTHAGDTQATYGQNVAGTIGGKAAQGWGQWLTGTEGGVKDLKVKITSATTGDKGVVKLGQGFATRLANYATQTSGADEGLLTRATGSVTDDIDRLNEEVTTMQAGVDSYVADLQLKFATMEGVLAKNKSLLSYLQTQIAGLQGLSVDQNA